MWGMEKYFGVDGLMKIEAFYSVVQRGMQRADSFYGAFIKLKPKKTKKWGKCITIESANVVTLLPKILLLKIGNLISAPNYRM